MRLSIRLLATALLVTALTLPAVGCDPPTRAEPDVPRETSGENATLKQVKELYDKAKAAGEKVPGDVMEWTRSEVKRFGSWEYEVVDVDLPTAARMKSVLDGLGAERWECFHVIDRGGGTVALVCKRPTRSYLRAIPFKELVRLVPIGGSDGD